MKNSGLKAAINGLAVSVLYFYLFSPFFGLLIERTPYGSTVALGVASMRVMVWSLVYAFLCILLGAYYGSTFSKQKVMTILTVGLVSPFCLHLPYFLNNLLAFFFSPYAAASQIGEAVFYNLTQFISSLVAGLLAVLLLLAFGYGRRRTERV